MRDTVGVPETELTEGKMFRFHVTPSAAWMCCVFVQNHKLAQEMAHSKKESREQASKAALVAIQNHRAFSRYFWPSFETDMDSCSILRRYFKKHSHYKDELVFSVARRSSVSKSIDITCSFRGKIISTGKASTAYEAMDKACQHAKDKIVLAQSQY
jgi:dsRNA-specific ribonuclease